MKSIQEILLSIFAKIDLKHKWQKDFLLELFTLLYSIQGRINFENLARYSPFHESTFRRNFSKFFAWLDFNLELMYLGGLRFSNPVIAVMDCSFISKAGKATFGLDKFWSGVANGNKKGLELSLLALIDVLSGTAWALDATQTPPGLSSKEGQGETYTRIDFYLEQLTDLVPKLKKVLYFVADGYYAKAKIFNTLSRLGKYLITKLRPDANLRYLYTGPHPKAKKGPKTKYAGKVNWKQIDLSKWLDVGRDNKYAHLHIYTQILNSPHFKRNFRVVLLFNTKTSKYILLASTHLDLEARVMVKYYQLRFQIEFLFRDAKQFTGLNHCQARAEEKLDFHFNLSLAAINLAKVIGKFNPSLKSMNALVRRAYNTKLVELLFSKLSLKAEFDLNHPQVQAVLNLGCMQRE